MLQFVLIAVWGSGIVVLLGVGLLGEDQRFGKDRVVLIIIWPASLPLIVLVRFVIWASDQILWAAENLMTCPTEQGENTATCEK